jgi:hypothetical protein
MRAFGDAIEEIYHRLIDLRQLVPRDLSSKERAQAYADLPRELVDLFSGKGRDKRNQQGMRSHFFLAPGTDRMTEYAGIISGFECGTARLVVTRSLIGSARCKRTARGDRGTPQFVAMN